MAVACEKVRGLDSNCWAFGKFGSNMRKERCFRLGNALREEREEGVYHWSI